MRLTTTCAICAFAAAAAAGASAQPETRTYTGGRFMLDIGGEPGLIGSAESGAPQHRIEIESWSWGAAQAGASGAVLGRGAPIQSAIPMPEVVAPRDIASGQASGKRKGWDGSVKGNSVSTAKFGAIAGAHRDESLGKPAARTAPPPSPGSLTVDGRFPGCTVGKQYANAVLQLGGARYTLADVQITSCPAATATVGGPRTPDSLSLNYKKVTVRGWDPATKQE